MLFDADNQSSLKICPKLSNDHFVLPFGKKMKVSLAVQIFSRSVATGLQIYAHDGILPEEVNETAHFVKQIDELWNLLNSSTYSAEKLDDITKFRTFIQWIEKWSFVNQEGLTKDKLPFKKCLLITLSSFSLMMLELLTQRRHQLLSARRFNQDSLENTFAMIRHDRGGFNSNPELSKALQCLRIVSSAKLILKNNTNCETLHEDFIFDFGKSFSISLVSLTHSLYSK